MQQIEANIERFHKEIATWIKNPIIAKYKKISEKTKEKGEK